MYTSRMFGVSQVGHIVIWAYFQSGVGIKEAPFLTLSLNYNTLELSAMEFSTFHLLYLVSHLGPVELWNGLINCHIQDSPGLSTLPTK